MTCPTTRQACECVSGSIRQRECVAVAIDVLRNLESGDEKLAETAAKFQRRLQALEA